MEARGPTEKDIRKQKLLNQLAVKKPYENETITYQNEVTRPVSTIG